LKFFSLPHISKQGIAIALLLNSSARNVLCGIIDRDFKEFSASVDAAVGQLLMNSILKTAALRYVNLT
jgi:hypothetical protein